ncbi:MAG: hypothetical protein MI784_11150 [Cytophagales bacterium]|nr:hypothetical protein [Cytophagales bacterium]
MLMLHGALPHVEHSETAYHAISKGAYFKYSHQGKIHTAHSFLSFGAESGKEHHYAFAVSHAHNVLPSSFQFKSEKMCKAFAALPLDAHCKALDSCFKAKVKFCAFFYLANSDDLFFGNSPLRAPPYSV